MPDDRTAKDSAHDNPQALSAESEPGCLWRGLVAIGSWFVHFLALAMFTFTATALASQCRGLLEDVGVDVPPFVELFLFVSTLIWNYWYLLFVLLLLIDGPILLALQFLPDNRKWLARLWFRGWLTAILLATGITIICVQLAFSIALSARAGGLPV